MNIDFQEILKELEFRLPKGIIDLNQEEHVTTLVDILRENGVDNANEYAQKARVIFGFINEDDIVKNKKSGNIYVVQKMNPAIHTKPTPAEVEKAKVANGGKIPTDSGNNKPKSPETKGKKVFGGTGTDVFTKNVDVKAGKVVSVKTTSKYTTKGSKEVNQEKANNRLKYLPKSSITTEQAISNFKKTYKNAVTTNYDYPKQVDKLLRAKLPPAGYDALKSILKMSKQGDFEPPISMITDQYGAGKISAQTNELAMQAVFCFPSTKEGIAARNEFINSLSKNADDIEKAGGIPILDKSWIKEFSGAHDSFIQNMNRTHGEGKWEVSGMTWDVRKQQESLGIDYDNKGDSTDINAQIKVNGKVYNEEISCKKDWNIFLLNAGLGEASNWYYTLGPDKEKRADELTKMKEAKDPNFKKKEEAELKELQKQALSKAPISNKELQNKQMQSAEKGCLDMKEVPKKDFAVTIKDCLSRKKNDPYVMDRHEAELATKVQKYLNGTKNIDVEEFQKYIGGGSKDFKKAVMVYHKLMGAYQGDDNWLNEHKKITYDFIEQSAKKMATDKEFQSMLLKKLQEAIPVKTMVEGVENMQIDSMYITQKHMQEMFGTSDWNSIKEFLSIKVNDGIASLTYSAKGKTNDKPLKIANIQMREKGIGYSGSPALECLPSKEFQIACKDIDKKLNNTSSIDTFDKKTIKNPETGEDISIASALKYDKNSPVYKAAAKLVKK